MKSIFRAISIAFFSTILMSSLSYGEVKPGHDAKDHSSGIESLSPELRELLKKEMLAFSLRSRLDPTIYCPGDT